MDRPSKTEIHFGFKLEFRTINELLIISVKYVDSLFL